MIDDTDPNSEHLPREFRARHCNRFPQGIPDHEFLERNGDMEDAQRLLATESAIQAAALVGGTALTEALRKASSDHPHIGIRQAALSALESMKKSPPGADP